MNAMRYSQHPFPEYRFIPGKTPHPTRDPGGHSRGRDDAEPLEQFDPLYWHNSEAYLYGVDLYNHGYWWEAHECWIAAGKNTQTGLFLQGLIQVAAGCLKKHQGHEDAGRRLAFEGMEKFPLRHGRLLGIELAPLKQALTRFFNGERDDQPVIELVFPDRDAGK